MLSHDQLTATSKTPKYSLSAHHTSLLSFHAPLTALGLLYSVLRAHQMYFVRATISFPLTFCNIAVGRYASLIDHSSVPGILKGIPLLHGSERYGPIGKYE